MMVIPSDTLSYKIFENNGLSVLSVDNYEPDQNKVLYDICLQ